MTDTPRITASESELTQPHARRASLRVADRISLDRWHAKSPWPYLVLLVVIWLALLALLLLLQVLGVGIGLRVWPMGEDHTWIELLWRNGLLGAPSAWWTGHGRNPLAPWWTVVTAPLVLGFDYGIYLVRKPLDLLCAVAVFLLLYQIGRGRYPLFAFACALLTLLWNFSGYLEQSIWPYIAALGLATLSIWLYCRFLDSGRRAPFALALSLLLYLVVIATYTLQASMLLAIPFLALVRGDGRDSLRSWRRLGMAAADTSLFGSVLLFFLAIWTATRPPATESFFTLSSGEFVDNAIASLRNLVWHYDYSGRLLSILDGWHQVAILFTILVSATLFSVLLWRIGKNDGEFGSQSATSESNDDVPAPEPSFAATLGQAIGVALAIAVATFIVETMSSELWPPGARAKMIQQEWQPLLYSIVVFGIASLVVHYRTKFGRAVAVGGMTAILVVALLAGLDYNRTLSRNTAMEQRLEAGLKQLLPTIAEPVYIVVKPEGVDMPYWRNLSHIYAQTYYRTSLVNLHVLVPGSPVDQLSSHLDVIFGSDDQGMYSAPFGGHPIWTPYQQIMFVDFDGNTVSTQDEITRDEIDGYRVGWKRNGPITHLFQPPSPEDCPDDVDFDLQQGGIGWSLPEISKAESLSGVTFAWTDATRSTLNSPVPVRQPFDIEARIVGAMAPDILSSLRVDVNDTELPIVTSQDAAGFTIVKAVVSRSLLDRSSTPTEIAFVTNRTIVPSRGNRTLGLAFDYVRFSCNKGASGSEPRSTDVQSETEPAAQRGAAPQSSAPPFRVAATPSTVATTPMVQQVPSTGASGGQCPPSRNDPTSVVAVPCLTADPNPVLVVGRAGTTTIAWSVGDVGRGSSGQVNVSKDGRPEIPFVEGRRGAVKARIRAGSVYEYRLYDGKERNQLLASVVVGTTE